MKNANNFHFVFDLDGTLIDSLQDISDSMNQTLKQYHLVQHNYKFYKEVIGYGIAELIKDSLPASYRENQDFINTFLRSYSLNYEKNMLNKTKLYFGIKNLIDILYHRGISMSVLSNKSHSYVEKLTGYFFNSRVFSFVLGQTPGFRSKPNPDGIDYILKNCSSYKDECFLVGDSEVDILTAQNSGVNSIAVTWGFRSRETLSTQDPDFIVDTPNEIIEIIDL